jgi:hypothetical protein
MLRIKQRTTGLILLGQGAILMVCIVYAGFSAAKIFGQTTPAIAQDTSSLWWLDLSGSDSDGLYNFDFKSTTVSSTNVDWPMRFFFHENAEIDKVKNALDGCGGDPSIPTTTCSNGGEQSAYFDDNGYGQWDVDGGIKQANNCFSGSNHMRLYANPSHISPYDRNYSLTWGYFIFACVHKDYEGGSGGSCTTYYSADAAEEGWWVQRMLDYLPGWAQESNSYYWYNAEDPGDWDFYDGHWHWTQSNAWASYVEVD